MLLIWLVTQRTSTAETQEQNGRLRVLNEALRNQNMDLARELASALNLSQHITFFYFYYFEVFYKALLVLVQLIVVKLHQK